MTGGVGGEKKNKLCPMDTGRLPPFGTQFSLGGGGGHDRILWCESRFLTANSGVKTENKRSSARNLRLRFVVHLCFLS